MIDQPQEQQSESANSITNVSGGVNANAEQMTVGADVVGRDKIVGTYIEHYHAGAPLPPKPNVYHNLPQPDHGGFVGRDLELAKVLKILRPYPHSQYPMVTIDGIGGIGKSALALEVAHHYLRNQDQLPAEERFGALIWISAKQTQLTADGIVQRRQALRTVSDIVTAIAITLQREDILRARQTEQLEVVRQALTQQRTLLVIDNLETVDDDAVIEFLLDLPAPTKALVTTRQRLDVAFPVRLQGLPWDDAQQIILQECEKKTVTLTSPEARHLYDRTGGVPLALVWSIAQMSFGYPPNAVLLRLGQPNNDIARFCFDAAVSWLEGSPAYRLLLAMSLFATEASRDALGHITALPELDRDDGLVALEKLSLVNKTQGRFSLLPLTQTFVAQQLKLRPDVEHPLQTAFVQYFVAFCQANGGEQWRLYDNLDADLKNFQVAIELARQLRLWQAIGQLANSLVEFLDRRGLWNELVDLSTLAVEAGRELGDKQLIMKHMAFGLGWVKVIRFRDLEGGALGVAEGVRLALELGDRREYAIALRDQGVVESRRGKQAQAQAIFEQCHALFEELGDQRWAARTLGSMGSNAEKFGDQAAAAEFYTRAIKASEASGYIEQQALDLRRLGSILFQQGHIDEARLKVSEALRLAEPLHLISQLAGTYNTLARIEFASGHLAQSQQLAEQARHLVQHWGWLNEVQRLDQLLADIQVAQSVSPTKTVQETGLV